MAAKSSPNDRRPLVVATRRLPAETEERLADLFDAALGDSDLPAAPARLAGILARADIVVATLGDDLSAGVIAGAGPNLKLIANFGAGVDHIDLAAALAGDIYVSNTPGVNAADTAEVTLGLMLSVSHRMREAEALLRAGRWSGWSPRSLLGHRLSGKRLGILGLGRVGEAVARHGAGLGLVIHYHNRRPVASDLAQELGATFWDTLGGMLSNVDILSVHCPLTPETRGLVSRGVLEHLPRGAMVINTSRGGIVDESALAELLVSGHLGGAGLDVYETAPRVREELLSAPNTVLLPHIASATYQARIAMGERVILNIRSVLDGHAPPDRVLPS
ncbi:MAG: D-glycerate dehydrogenase [Alphaproteobacteria bacterium]|nr:D-glycerate dehydrogenase [Alphaproteobacteria bacterium]MDA8003737.1 D-glycerate dehydrogenase [Alphaproteobacteria bacterium]MDA8005960.1 D-glycerate dehydrogenase [Alphaproteobacteria bacterium]MDA8012855.1 D-glycerate dehydrogenase [Alphaproteobacteria bacterium]